jgi:LPXTG-site transpeptidase (sortase) family protein
VPSIDAHSSLVPLGLNADKTVQVPPVTEPLQAGWYSNSPTPGQVGPAVVLGHIDGNHQKGIFWRLHEVKKGDQVVIGRQDGSKATFTVTKVDQIAKKEFPTEAVYGNTTDPQIRLITCGGAFDAAAHSYLDNIIVYGTLNT